MREVANFFRARAVMGDPLRFLLSLDCATGISEILVYSFIFFFLEMVHSVSPFDPLGSPFPFTVLSRVSSRRAAARGRFHVRFS